MVHRDRLIGAKIYEDGRNLGVADVELPNVNYMTETMSGAGIMGEVSSVNAGNLESMTTTLNWNTINDDLLSLAAPKTHNLECYGALQHYDAATGEIIIQQARVAMRVMPTSLKLGTLSNNAKTESGNDFSVVYLKVDIDGQNKVEVDPLNYIMIINGKDYAADIRKALGM